MKTAVNLLPLMTDKESVTKQLIDAIELYESMLGEGKQMLIDFVLKTRLSASAKLRLAPEYQDVRVLTQDMRKHLLTRMSDVALQSKLQVSFQGNRSV